MFAERAQASLKVSENIKGKINYFYKNSFLVDIMAVLSEIRNEMVNMITKVMETDIVKQRLQYYQDSIKNSEEIITLVRDFVSFAVLKLLSKLGFDKIFSWREN